MKNSENIFKKIKDLEKQAENIEKLAYELIKKAPLEYLPTLHEYDWKVLPQDLIELQNTVITSYRSWYYSVLSLLKKYLPNEIQRLERCYENKSGTGYEFGVIDILHFNVEVYESSKNDIIKKFQSKFHVQKGLLSSMKGLDINELKKKLSTSEISIFHRLEHILQKFHEVALRLRNRISRPNRNGFEIEDEYDVQDLLHALLILEFKDVRTEEFVPSYAGNNSRVDFFLKNEAIFIETKKTRDTLTDKKLVEQLIIDIQYYQEHPDCKILYCFIYDPDDFIQNRAAIINDLSKGEREFKVRVIFSPTRL